MARLGLLFVLALCAFAAAMVPRERRSMPEEDTPPPSSSVATTSSGPTVDECDRDTPCSWMVYVRFTRTFDYNITNHCVCRPGTNCLYFDDDISISAYEYRCLPLSL